MIQHLEAVLTYEERSEKLYMYNLAERWLQGDRITVCKYLKGVNTKGGGEWFKVITVSNEFK